MTKFLFSVGHIRVKIWGLLAEGRVCSFYVGATFVALHFQHECIHAVTAWSLCIICHSELLYDGRVTANHFILAPSPLRLTTKEFLQLKPCGHSPYVLSFLTKRWGCRRTYNIGPHGYGECLYFPGSGQSVKSDTLEWWAPHGVWDESLKTESHLYASLAAVYWAHRAAFKCRLH
jgi:hypothetical protein